MQDFLPINKKDMKKRGWDCVDFVYVTGDAYIDHPSFGSAIISRLLESRGYRVGIIAQPDWRKKESIQVFGEPRLGFLVTAGNMDSMVNHYTVSRKHRQKDAYSPGGQMGAPTGYANGCLQQSDPSDLQTYTDHSRRHRGKSSSSGTL